jgi:drug/metabolite transporter (DMT)-like permease
LAGAILWSTGGVFIKEIDAGALSITAFRCLFAAFWLAPFVWRRRFPKPMDAAVSILLFTGLLGMYVGATKETTAANAIFLQYTAPVYVIILAPLLLHEHLRRSDMFALAICLTGIAVLFFGNQGDTNATGLWLGVGSGLFYGLFLLWLRRLRYADPIAVTFVNCIGVALLLAPVPGVWDVSSGDLTMLALMGLVQFAVPYVLFTAGLRLISGAEASLIALIEPVLNPIWVAIFVGEEPTTATVIGGAIILAGLAVRYGLWGGGNGRGLSIEAEDLAEPT